MTNQTPQYEIAVVGQPNARLHFCRADREVTLSEGRWSFGDAVDILGDILLPISLLNGPVEILVDDNLVGIIGRSWEMPSGRACIASADIFEVSEGVFGTINAVADTDFTAEVLPGRLESILSDPSQPRGGDRIVVRADGKEIIGLV